MNGRLKLIFVFLSISQITATKSLLLSTLVESNFFNFGTKSGIEKTL